VDAIAIRAAGGLVARDGTVLLVHRPRFDDWSLPKGKVKRGEHPLAAAVREVHEETAVWGVPGIRLPTVTYQVWSGESLVDKQVDWWAMTVAEDRGHGAQSTDRPDVFTPSDEVDGLAWLPTAEALRLLTYPRDRQVLGAYADLPPLRRPVVLLSPPSASRGPASERPLDPQEEAQASALADLVGLLRPGRLVSAPPVRCRQTLADLARALGAEVEIDARFDAGADPDTAAEALRRLANDEAAVVVCSEGAIIPAIVARLSNRSDRDSGVEAGEGLALSFSGERLVAADAITPRVS
jgi:8-oxo-dGTP diphosphatase